MVETPNVRLRLIRRPKDKAFDAAMRRLFLQADHQSIPIGIGVIKRTSHVSPAYRINDNDRDPFARLPRQGSSCSNALNIARSPYHKPKSERVPPLHRLLFQRGKALTQRRGMNHAGRLRWLARLEFGFKPFPAPVAYPIYTVFNRRSRAINHRVEAFVGGLVRLFPAPDRLTKSPMRDARLADQLLKISVFAIVRERHESSCGRIIFRKISIERHFESRNADVVKSVAVFQHGAELFVSLPLNFSNPWRGVAMRTANSDQFVRRVSPCIVQNVIGRIVRINCAQADSNLKAAKIRPFAREQQVQIPLAIRLGNMLADCAVIDDPKNGSWRWMVG